MSFNHSLSLIISSHLIVLRLSFSPARPVNLSYTVCFWILYPDGCFRSQFDGVHLTSSSHLHSCVLCLTFFFPIRRPPIRYNYAVQSTVITSITLSFLFGSRSLCLIHFPLFGSCFVVLVVTGFVWLLACRVRFVVFSQMQHTLISPFNKNRSLFFFLHNHSSFNPPTRIDATITGILELPLAGSAFGCRLLSSVLSCSSYQ